MILEDRNLGSRYHDGVVDKKSAWTYTESRAPCTRPLSKRQAQGRPISGESSCDCLVLGSISLVYAPIRLPRTHTASADSCAFSCKSPTKL